MYGLGGGGALQVYWIFADIFFIRLSSVIHNVCHWLSVSWSFISVLVILFIWSAFSSKNFVLKISMFACGMGFSILGVLFVVGGMQRAIKMLGGMCRVTGEWSKFRL